MNTDETKDQRERDAVKTLHEFAKDLKQLLDKYHHVQLSCTVAQEVTAEYDDGDIWQFIYLDEQ